MSGYRARRPGRRAPAGGLLPRLLSLPARLHVRWLVIALVMAAAVGLYGRVLATAPPMPPTRAPQTGTATSSPPPRATLP
ncbi:hypothetical protein [Streptomyces sp. HPF1205]|uniref:hypothetical protein n=1 Tax=Streptomyces sp. HPF1205 TaxID=2873262 RepID=UPI001CEC238B|nr:hypothetical protein [Streptomyces sp. HPF1205]